MSQFNQEIEKELDRINQDIKASKTEEWGINAASIYASNCDVRRRQSVEYMLGQDQFNEDIVLDILQGFKVK